MSSISSLTSSSTSADAFEKLRQKLFAKTDTNSDGTVSKEEFVANRPKNVSEAQAAALYDKIDTQGTNALTEAQLSAGLQANRPAHHVAKQADADSDDASATSTAQVSSDVLKTLLTLLNEINGSNSSTSTDAQFAKLDTDGDGKVSKSEFVAGRPADVSEADASSLFDTVDKQGTGSITKAQFAENAPPPPSASGATSADNAQTSSDQLVSQLLKAIETYVANSGNIGSGHLGAQVSASA